MAEHTEMQELLEEFQALESSLALKELELGCARLLMDTYLQRTDLGWLISMLPGSGGAMLAVSSGQRVNILRETIDRLEAERIELAAEKRLVEEHITSA